MVVHILITTQEARASDFKASLIHLVPVQPGLLRASHTALQGANTQMDTGYTVPVRTFVFRVRQHCSTSQKVHSVCTLDAEQSRVCCALLDNFPKPHVSKPQTSLLQVMAAAKVCEITHESPSVKSLRLLVADKDFSFKAGQW